MGMNFRHHSTAGQDADAGELRSGRHGLPRPGQDGIDWTIVQRAGRACCCPARPVVIAIMPPSADRPYRTELLLCGHHYHVNQQALRAAGATVLDIKGAPVTNRTQLRVYAGV